MSSPQRSGAADHSPPGRTPAGHDKRWRALAVTLLVGFMSLLDVTIVNVAVPSIQQGLHASSASVQWIVSGYALTFGLTLVAGGRLGDVVGRREMFLIGLVLFTLTSAAAGLAPSEHLLVAARLLQGAAAGLLTPQNSGLIQQLFQGEERGRAFGLFGTTVGVSSAIGPVLGGLIIAAFGTDDGWRWVFFVNVPIGLLGMVLALRWLPKAEPREGSVRSQIDGTGSLLLGVAVLAVLLPIVEAMGDPATPLWFLVLLAPVAAWAFVRWERRVVRRGGAPLLDVRLFAQAPGYASGIVLGTAYFCGFSGIWLVLALYLQDGLGFTALQSGLTVTPFAIGSALASVTAGRRHHAARPAGDGVRAVPGGGRVRRAGGGRAAHLAVAPGAVAAGPAVRRRGRRRRDDLAEHHDDALARCRRGWAARRAARCRPGSGSAARSAPPCSPPRSGSPPPRAARSGRRCASRSSPPWRSRWSRW